ncbi:MAG: HesA/MoeB/ThiF family protein [Oscillospiraceae bacterium]|nr:HesA/MoeB/ThiF family protein [Oscillospiraceae bacterium]
MHEVVYSRQTIIKDIGEEGQQKLAAARVLVVGCGGLGAPVLYYLTAMGIGHIGLCDNDVVSMSNLNRQILFTTADIGKPKAVIADIRIKALNPTIKTTVYQQTMDKELANSIIPDYDIVMDCLDNFSARFIINDACVALGKPFVHAGVEEFYGQLMTVMPGKGPCLRCLFPNGIKEISQKKQIGIIGATAGVLGSLQAQSAAKIILKMETASSGLVTYNGVNCTLETINLEPNPQCICRKEQ